MCLFYLMPNIYHLLAKGSGLGLGFVETVYFATESAHLLTELHEPLKLSSTIPTGELGIPSALPWMSQ